MAAPLSEDGDPGFQIAPMVDVVFVLMLFFMACAGMQMVEGELSINVPERPSGQTTTSVIHPIFVDIASDGSVSANGMVYGRPGDKELRDFRHWLGGVMTTYSGEDPVIIRPAADVRHSRIVDVLDAAVASGVRKLSFG